MEQLQSVGALAFHERTKDKVRPDLSSDTPSVIPWLDKILENAIQAGASDIHFEPYENKFRVRYRLDGVLFEIANPPLQLAVRVTARLKVLANLDTAERRLPQDGRFHWETSQNNRVDLRLNSCPTMHGEKIVIRVLDPHKTQLMIADLGFDSEQTEHFLNAIKKPQGMILITGPTGSGKTSSLYTALRHLNIIEKNVVTVENPIEIKLDGINQVQINPGIDLTFAKALRAILRQDPDVIMIGEIRDRETAEIALQAAQTGHLVFSTLHTNSASETFLRLQMMGVEPHYLVNSIHLIIAQRLIRRLCPKCKVKEKEAALLSSSSALKKLGFSLNKLTTLSLYRAQGCKDCNQGYLGRIGLFEMMLISSALQRLLTKQKDAQDLLKQAQSEGMVTLSQMAFRQLAAGVTTLEEVQRVLSF
ncbi:MAG: Flp pilus assembly complex ATPase component TadA [Legionella sp.]|nr:Flp pilus assembly complex ATPase component TadA [Legionella sp.]